MKKYVVLLLALIIVVCGCLNLAGCGKTDLNDNSQQVTADVKEQADVTEETEGEIVGSSDKQETAETENKKPVKNEDKKPVKNENKKPVVSDEKVCSHSYSKATCTSPAMCMKCGLPQGDALGHSFIDASCTKPAMCTKCGLTKGAASGHLFSEATCSAPAKCSVCGVTNGEIKTGHNYVSGTCSDCGVVLTFKDASNSYLFLDADKYCSVYRISDDYIGFKWDAANPPASSNRPQIYNQKIVGYDSMGNQTFYTISELYYADQVTLYLKCENIPSTTTMIMVSDFYG